MTRGVIGPILGETGKTSEDFYSIRLLSYKIELGGLIEYFNSNHSIPKDTFSFSNDFQNSIDPDSYFLPDYPSELNP